MAKVVRLLIRDPLEVLLRLGIERGPRGSARGTQALLVAGCRRRGGQVAEEAHHAGGKAPRDRLRDVPRLGDAPRRRDVIDEREPRPWCTEEPTSPSAPSARPERDPLQRARWTSRSSARGSRYSSAGVSTLTATASRASSRSGAAEAAKGQAQEAQE